ncbi:nucleic acid-binding, OB-fold protein [Artemisia annua]|uniref:Nucleic acid-binding, OB-fold protein n=1 Tax=Artemisia annua TaxID=35608 RepID=A0A2U1QDC5_ARTAN|nr:nucleic acid-binding, OB-fold protein [Artemisia annua]
MAATSKGKAIDVPYEVVTFENINPAEMSKAIEVKVYRKWIAKTVPDLISTMYCCILLDRKGQAVQANIELKDVDKYNSIELNLAYRIRRFGCQPPEKSQQTVTAKYTLLFGKLTELVPIHVQGFPEHYFQFAPYNVVCSRADMKQPLLTVRLFFLPFNAPKKSRNPNLTINYFDSGNSIWVTLWNELAEDFKNRDLTTLQQPVVMAVSSCYVKRYAAGAVQLSTTPATQFYLNPNILETKTIHNVYEQLLGSMPPLLIQQPTDQNPENIDTGNKVSIAQMLAVDPEIEKGMRFTVEATFVRVDNTNRWFYNKCNECGKHMDEKSPHWQCHQSGVQEIPNYGYCFKVIVEDDTGSVIVSCFTPEADKWTPKTCLEVLNEAPNPDPYIVPAALRSLENTRKVFGIHFGAGSKRRRQKFVLSTVKDLEPLLLPAPATNTLGEGSSSDIVALEQETQYEEPIPDEGTPPPQTQETPMKPENETQKMEPDARKELFPEALHDPTDRDKKKQKKE